jgi:His/Glu/Gln/Arg/opine family amino acid ABC transporter permease subunit
VRELLAWSDQLAQGLGVTVRLALGAYAVGLVLGLGGASARLSGSWALDALAKGYMTVFRSLPEILVVFLIFYGGGIVLRFGVRLVGADRYVELNAFAAGVVALGLV